MKLPFQKNCQTHHNPRDRCPAGICYQPWLDAPPEKKAKAIERLRDNVAANKIALPAHHGRDRLLVGGSRVGKSTVPSGPPVDLDGLPDIGPLTAAERQKRHREKLGDEYRKWNRERMRRKRK